MTGWSERRPAYTAQREIQTRVARRPRSPDRDVLSVDFMVVDFMVGDQVVAAGFSSSKTRVPDLQRSN